MPATGVRRVAMISAYPIVGIRPRLPIAVLRFVFAESYADAAEMEQILAGSDLDWTVLRLNRLTDGPPPEKRASRRSCSPVRRRTRVRTLR